MKKLYLMAIFAISLLSCTANTEDGSQPTSPGTPANPNTPSSPSSPDNGSHGESPYSSLISKTTAYPSSYAEEASHQGRIERIDYDTRDYAEGTNRARTNTAYVYLPYGYDENTTQRYNVIYLVHGHYGTASTTFEAEGGLQRKVLDHMIENGDVAPTIVVSPSYNYGQPTSNYVDADPYCRALPHELVNDLIPLVETRYRTYLTSPDLEGIIASRDHRAIGGFSMGGVTTWYALAETFSAFRYYLPISGDCWSLGSFAGMNRPTDTANYLADIIRQSPFANDFYIWAASGTSDSAYSETLLQVRGMAQLTDVFGLDHMTFHEKDGARHEFLPTPEYVYNALPFFFPPQSTTDITNITESRKSRHTVSYNIEGKPSNGKGIVIENGRKYIKK